MVSYHPWAAKTKKELDIFIEEGIAKTMLLKMCLRENVTADIIDAIIKIITTVTPTK